MKDLFGSVIEVIAKRFPFHVIEAPTKRLETCWAVELKQGTDRLIVVCVVSDDEERDPLRRLSEIERQDILGTMGRCNPCAVDWLYVWKHRGVFGCIWGKTPPDMPYR
jgi:hypothetical protein